MKVILLQDIKNVGKKGQVLDAADGYARNFLLPRKLAEEATKGNMTVLAQKEHAEKTKAARELAEMQAYAALLEGKRVIIPVKTGEGGKLFGSVTAKEITQALSEQKNLDVDKKKINLKDPIKTIGETTVELKLAHDVTAHIIVDIVAKV